MRLLGLAIGAGALALTLTSVARAVEPGPSFDCSRAVGSAERLVCSDAELAAMDRELDAIFKRALQQFPETETPELNAMQLGWAKGRNDCWKADDLRACVTRNYQMRITELQIQTGALTAPKATAFGCLGGESIAAVFYSHTKLPSAVLTRSPDDQVIAYLVPSASGSKYEGRNVTFWLKGKEAAVSWVDHRWTCSTR
jgi:uncharacterized protein